MDETLNRINQYANERHTLYRLAAKEHLTPTQLERLQKLDSDLITLWDNYRRELASRQYPQLSGGLLSRVERSAA